MKLFIVISLMAGATAFTSFVSDPPLTKPRPLSATNVNVAELPNDEQPQGNVKEENTAISAPVNRFTVKGPWHDKPEVMYPLTFVDPLGLLKEADEEQYQKLCFHERKHARWAMFAYMGNLAVLYGWRFPGYISQSAQLKFADMPSHGVEALEATPKEGAVLLLFAFLLAEIGMETMDQEEKGEFKGDYTGYLADDLGWDAPQKDWASRSAKFKKAHLAMELTNGRAAMFGIAGLIAHDFIGNLDDMPVVGTGTAIRDVYMSYLS